MRREEWQVYDHRAFANQKNNLACERSPDGNQERFYVAELAAEMCGPLFSKTTAAQVPVDGWNDQVLTEQPAA